MERSILDRAADVRAASAALEEEIRIAKEAGVETFVFYQTARHFDQIIDTALSHALIGLHEMRGHLRTEIRNAQPDPPATPPMQAG